MKILHIIYTEGVSGAEKHLMHLLPGLKDYGYECELLIVCSPASAPLLRAFAKDITAAGVKSVVIVSLRRFSLSIIKKISRYIRNNNFAVVHSHLVRTDLMISLIKMFFFRKLFIISTKHGYREEQMVRSLKNNYKVSKDFFWYVTRFTLRQADENISVSEYLSTLFFNSALSAKRFPVVYHGIDVPVEKANVPLPAEFSGGPLLAIVGRLIPLKGHFYLFHALPAVVAKYPGCKLFVIGDGALRAPLEQLAQKLGLSNNIVFTGFQKNPYSFVAACDVVIITSLIESFGLVFIEAMALKTPIISFNVPAANEILKDGETAILTPPENSEALTSNILMLLNNKEMRDEISQNAAEAYKKNFTVKTMVQNTAKLYKIFLQN